MIIPLTRPSRGPYVKKNIENIQHFGDEDWYFTGFVGVLPNLVIPMVEAPYYHHTWAVWGVKTSGILV